MKEFIEMFHKVVLPYVEFVVIWLLVIGALMFVTGRSKAIKDEVKTGG